MRRHYTITLLIGLTLAVGAAKYQETARAKNLGTDRVVVGERSRGGGNSFARMISAPFRAIGRLFDGDRKDGRRAQSEEAKQTRTTDAGREAARGGQQKERKFEVVTTTRITDARTQGSAPVPEAESADAETVPAMLSRGREMLSRNRLNEAIALLSRAVSVDPNSFEGHSMLGVAFDRKGLPEAARDSYETALRIDPNNPQTLNNYGYSLYMRGDCRGAVEHLKRAARISPQDARVWNNLALAQFRLNKFDDAYRSFVKAGGEFKGHMNIANMLERSGRDKEALRHYEAARRFDPSSLPLLQQLANIYQRMGRLMEAEAARQLIQTPAKDNAKVSNGGQM